MMRVKGMMFCLKMSIDRIERVQQEATMMILGLRNTFFENRPVDFSFDYRKLRGDSIQVFRFWK